MNWSSFYWLVGDIEAMCHARLEELAPNRLNVHRVNRYLSTGNPEIERMWKLVGLAHPSR
jgi:hypothetical protein